MFGSLLLFAGAALRCGGSSGAGSSGAGSSSGGSSAAHAGSGGKPAGSGGNSGAAGAGASDSVGGAAGSGGDSNLDAGLTSPVIGDIASIDVVENTVATTTAHVSFQVMDDGGLAGITATATSANATHVEPGKVTCSNGTCTLDVKVTPTITGSIAVTVVVTNRRGGSAMSEFAVSISPLTVTTGADSGAGSLRATVAAVKPGDVVVFDAAVIIVQLSEELNLIRALTLSGPGAAALTIDGGSAGQAISMSADGVAISGVTIAHGTTASVGVYNAHVSLANVVITGSGSHGLGVSGSEGKRSTVDATNSTFSGNATNGAVLIASGANSAATGNFKGCTFTANLNGLGAVTDAVGQAATINLLGGNQVHDNTDYGIVLEIDNSLGAVTLNMPPAGGTGDNVVTKNPVGVFRSGPVASAALKIAPATQVTANTANFTPVWP